MIKIELLTPDEIADLLKIDRRSFVRSVCKQPGFPSPVRLGERMLRWHSDDIEQWIQRQTRRSF